MPKYAKRGACEEINMNTSRPVKRARTNFQQSQLAMLEQIFQQTQYPDVTILEALAGRLDLPIEKVCTWFQNRRSRFRKESKTGHVKWMRNQFFAPSAERPLPLDVLKLPPVSPAPPVANTDNALPCDLEITKHEQDLNAYSHCMESRMSIPKPTPRVQPWYSANQTVSPTAPNIQQQHCTQSCCAVTQERIATTPSCANGATYSSLTDAIYQRPCHPYSFFWPPGAYQSSPSFQYGACPPEEPQITLEQGDLRHGVSLSSIRTFEAPVSHGYPSFPPASPHLPELIPDSHQTAY